jgi:hypothetical protein
MLRMPDFTIPLLYVHYLLSKAMMRRPIFIVVFFMAGALAGLLIHKFVQPAQILPKDKPSLVHRLARDKMQAMVTENNFDHISVDGCDLRCRRIKNETGITWVGENLYRGNNCDYQFAYKMWMESKTHRDNLEHAFDYSVLLTERNAEYCYMVQIFVQY